MPILNLSELLYSKLKELQQEGKQEEKEMLEMSEIILRNANRLHQLTEDILDVTRIESNTLTLRKERLNLNDVILNVVQDYRRQIANSSSNNGNVEVIYKPAKRSSNSSSDAILVVEADKRRLTQVISNLLNNAIKFTQEGSVSVSTRIIKRKAADMDKREREAVSTAVAEEEGKEEEEVLIAIKDTGTGIDPELMPRLFTKFATKSYQGTGLGLFISKSIVEAHGGKMWAENNSSNSNDDNDNNNDGSNNNRKHSGATFYFTLPIADIFEERTKEKEGASLVNEQP